jgi:hypothetical protein
MITPTLYLYSLLTGYHGLSEENMSSRDSSAEASPLTKSSPSSAETHLSDTAPLAPIDVNNLFSVLEDLSISSDERSSTPDSLSNSSDSPPGSLNDEEFDEDPDNMPDEGDIYEVDLLAFENEIGDDPIFERCLLQRYARLRDRAKEEPESTLEVDDIHGSERTWIVWTDPQMWVPQVGIEYLHYVELSSAYEPQTPSGNVLGLHAYNSRRKVHAHQHIAVPMYLFAYDESTYTVESLNYWRKKLPRFKELWVNSSCSELLRQKFTEAAKTTVQIKKLVCLGFGAFSAKLKEDGTHDHRFCDPLQYMAALTIGSALFRAYRKEDHKALLPEIIFQDPCYTAQDRLLWTPQATGYKNIRFASDPDGFLAIDDHTLVIAPFLPISVPYLQICADLVPGGPAGIICDIKGKKLDPERRMYAVKDRITPRVVIMLLNNNYERSNFDDHVVPDDMYEECCRKSKYMGYWLWSMDCFLKQKTVET